MIILVHQIFAAKIKGNVCTWPIDQVLGRSRTGHSIWLDQTTLEGLRALMFFILPRRSSFQPSFSLSPPVDLILPARRSLAPPTPLPAIAFELQPAWWRVSSCKWRAAPSQPLLPLLFLAGTTASCILQGDEHNRNYRNAGTTICRCWKHADILLWPVDRGGKLFSMVTSTTTIGRGERDSNAGTSTYFCYDQHETGLEPTCGFCCMRGSELESATFLLQPANAGAGTGRLFCCND